MQRPKRVRRLERKRGHQWRQSRRRLHQRSRRLRDSASGPVADVAADAGPKLAARVSGRPQATVASTATASWQLVRSTQSGRIVRILDTARSTGPGQRFKAMPATLFQV
ncbi:hypothetical protein NDU88_003698 [Pleurodeles waltl]|uniref:Uncharacterized protein n=1 Tax=Pleurodeles waltl TaxID=8319 RepID=A0AAV7NLD0_PLEWA|nr:hypothetical protein NDU88_003698 [Pleurodeles waltl]